MTTYEDAEGRAADVAAVRAVGAAERELARRIVLRYTLTATAILFAAGAMGIIMRDSQGDVGVIDDNTWYALMSAHGLGAFLGWAGFAVMGFAFWILTLVGFPLRRFGSLMAEATYWLMTVGVVGILVGALALDFAGSWVFLYPLPFHSAGQWGEWGSAIFLAAVLLVGLSIVTWCLAILHTVVGPALHAVRSGVANRLGVAMGFGFLAPRRFATNPTPVPYAVIPLTVIGIDMIIATLPLAALLVEMIIQSFTPSVSVDPLLAKNVLWWFGHPVVYLLLFPAVAIYYYLVPRLAGRPLVAGHVIAVAWAIAVIANVLVWAHHIYLDYPSGGVQGAINTAMQPMTFALTIPSAISLYSLSFTIYRSRYRWDAAGTGLFLALLSWFLAGMSGVVNATIDFDEIVHNTLWIVGHFHHMALINIGLVVFSATYYFLPQLLGRQLYSDGLAKWHLWLTFLLGTANTVLWLVQGLEGGPRRFSQLPARYEALSTAAVPLVMVLGLAQLLFAWNVIQTVRGKVYVPRFAAPVREATLVLLGVGALLAGGGALVGWVVATSGRGPSKPLATATAGTTPAPAVPPGAAVFASAGCGGCHTLEAADAHGTVGPNLGRTALNEAQIRQVVTNGRRAMPSFKGRLTPAQIQAVAAFVAASREK